MRKIILILFLLLTAKGFCQFEPIPKAITRPYKIYTALLTQSGTSAPTATVLENTLGGTVVWSYVDVGIYWGSLTGAFTSNKTVILPTNETFANSNTFSITDIQTNHIEIMTDVNGALPPFFVLEIRVYN